MNDTEINEEFVEKQLRPLEELRELALSKAEVTQIAATSARSCLLSC